MQIKTNVCSQQKIEWTCWYNHHFNTISKKIFQNHNAPKEGKSTSVNHILKHGRIIHHCKRTIKVNTNVISNKNLHRTTLKEPFGSVGPEKLMKHQLAKPTLVIRAKCTSYPCLWYFKSDRILLNTVGWRGKIGIINNAKGKKNCKMLFQLNTAHCDEWKVTLWAIMKVEIFLVLLLTKYHLRNYLLKITLIEWALWP